MEEEKCLMPGKFVVAYTGLLSTRHDERPPLRSLVKHCLGLDYHPVHSDVNTRSARWFLASAERMLDRQPQLCNVLKLVFVGAFSENDQAVLRSFPYQQCLDVRGPMPSHQTIELCCRANLLLLLQIEMRVGGRDFCTAIPGKLYNYLRTGTRILAPMQRNDASMLIEEFNAGIVVPPRDIDAIASCLAKEISDWQNAGRTQRRRIPPPSLRKYDRRQLCAELAEVLKQVAVCDCDSRMHVPLGVETAAAADFTG